MNGSHATVSRLLKGYAGIRPETRDRVAEAIRELGYRPNLNARSLTSGRSHRIAALKALTRQNVWSESLILVGLTWQKTNRVCAAQGPMVAVAAVQKRTKLTLRGR